MISIVIFNIYNYLSINIYVIYQSICLKIISPCQAQYSGGWGSPSWSGAGPPGGPPPMSMTPPPLSWNQPQPRHRPQPGYQQQNKPFGNVQYQGMVQVRSRYIFINISISKKNIYRASR